MSKADQAEPDAYVLGRTVEEYERLRAQAQMLEEATARTLQKAGIQPGMRCLDAGSGPGEVMRLIGRVVGPSGFVTGIDLDEALGTYALAQLHAKEGKHFAFVRGDLTAMRDAPDGPYDLIYTRLTLFHIGDPVAVLKTLWSWLKPGGTLIAMDYDMTNIRGVPESTAGADMVRLIKETMTRAGRDIAIGAHLPRHFMRAGIAPIAGTDVASHFGPLARLGDMPRAVLKSLGPAAIKLGIASGEEIARVDQAFAAEMSDPSVFMFAPLVISAWARKPG